MDVALISSPVDEAREKLEEYLFAVVGEWDLTDIERAIMRDRARS